MQQQQQQDDMLANGGFLDHPRRVPPSELEGLCTLLGLHLGTMEASQQPLIRLCQTTPASGAAPGQVGSCSCRVFRLHSLQGLLCWGCIRASWNHATLELTHISLSFLPQLAERSCWWVVRESPFAAPGPWQLYWYPQVSPARRHKLTESPNKSQTCSLMQPESDCH